MKTTSAVLVTFALTLVSGCASVANRSYGDGWVKSSPVSCSFVAQPRLQSMTGRSYHVAGGEATRLAAFEQQGMKQSRNAPADVVVHIELGAYREGEPSAGKLGSKWYPAFEVTVPYKIAFRGGDGSMLAQHEGQHSGTMTFSQMQGFATREEAVGAIDLVRKLGAKGVKEKAMKDAREDAAKAANDAAAGLFEPRTVSIQVPVVRSAAGVDMEPTYEVVAAAKDEAQLRAALQAYEQCGTDHTKADGTPNATGNYGVLCSIAATKLLLDDLHGAWDACKRAGALLPAGDEVAEIRRAVYERDRATGKGAIPEAERPASTRTDLMRQLRASPAR